MRATFTFTFLDGHIQTSTFSYDRSNPKELVRQLFRILRVWQSEYDLAMPQIILYNRLHKRIEKKNPSHLIPDEEGGEKRDEEGDEKYTFSVLFVPLVQVDRLTLQEVEELYTDGLLVETEVNEDSFRRFASVLWVDHVNDQQIVFYRVKDRHVGNIANASNIASVGYRWSCLPCWEFGTIPMTDMAKKRWNYLNSSM